MSKHDWKPGDVAAVSSWRGNNQIGIRVHPRDPKDPLMWCVFDGSDTRGLSDAETTSARPLVVLDPDDREQVERLVRAYYSAFPGVGDSGRVISPGTVNAMTAGLRSLVVPPRPTEPTGLGAVVEDEQGRTLVRYAREGVYADHCWHDGINAYAWNEITATRVLSEGVQ